MLTCKDSRVHYPVCKDTVADKNWTDEAPEFLKELYSPKACKYFSLGQKAGTWTYYSTTMMECSVCKKHVPRHRYNYCPECGSRMLSNSLKKPIEDDGWKQLTLFDIENLEV